MGVSERFQGANVIDAGRLSPYWGEHAARYVFALPFVDGKSVLDIACGTGYGIGLLRSKARFVTGVDIDPGAAKEAKNECGDNGVVMLGNGLGLPFEDNSFDVITSFETLEHLHDRSKFLAEQRRVLQPGGMLLLSTPNANYTRPVNGKPSNPFHVFEYTPKELLAELEKHFVVSQILGQKLNESAGITPFYEAQQRLPKDIFTQLRLFCWKVINKMPFTVRERLSEAIWQKPFYPTERDYLFLPDSVDDAPVLVALCHKRIGYD